MKFLTKTWIQTQFSNFAARIALIFAKKAETNEHFTQKSTQSILGHVKLSNSAAVTIAGEYALDAVEKNASVEGTLANMISQANSKLTSIGTVVTGNAIEKTISVAYEHDSISETISLIPGTYIFIIRVEYKIATDRSVLVALVQDDNWNVMSWAFTTEGQSPSVYGGVSAKSYVFALQINSNHSYKVEIGINWLTEGDNNAAKALLQAIRIA